EDLLPFHAAAPHLVPSHPRSPAREDGEFDGPASAPCAPGLPCPSRGPSGRGQDPPPGRSRFRLPPSGRASDCGELPDALRLRSRGLPRRRGRPPRQRTTSVLLPRALASHRNLSDLIHLPCELLGDHSQSDPKSSCIRRARARTARLS